MSVEADKSLWFPLGEVILFLADYLVLSKIIFKAAIAVVYLNCKTVDLDYKTLSFTCPYW